MDIAQAQKTRAAEAGERPVEATRASVLARYVAEVVGVVVVLAALGLLYLRPATTELLRGNAAVMIGDNTDSVTNPWQYGMLLETLRTAPQNLLFGAVHTDQLQGPEGYPAFIPMIERIFVVLFAPFMGPDLMSTAMVWALMVLSGACFYACGRLHGFPRPVALALAIAWAYCPFTRARAVVHIALVGLYWAPLAIAALHVLARPPGKLTSRGATIAAGAMLLFASFAAHYFVMIAALFAPLFALYYFMMLPRGASRVGALGRLALAALPAFLFVAWSALMPVPAPAARALAGVVQTRSETDNYLKYYGAHPIDYVLGDTKFGHEDVLPLRRKLTREAREEVKDNRHERTNGIRWTVLAAFGALAIALSSKRLRRRLSETDRRVGAFALVLAGAALLFAMSPHGLKVYETDLGPVQLFAKIYPKFRVPNRIGTLVHFAALLGAGVMLTRVFGRTLAKKTPGGLALGVALPLVMVVDYLPIEPVPIAAVVRRRAELEPVGAACGSGITVPYVGWGFHDEDYYRASTELRGTSCKMLHAAYLTTEDERLRAVHGKTEWSDAQREAAVRLVRCAGASFVIFRLDAPEPFRQAVCADLGWSFTSPDACRAATAVPFVRSLRACLE